MMSPPRLPPELADRMIDFCHDDTKTLSNCALTHSSWLPASRFHLFHTVTSSAMDRIIQTDQLKFIIINRLILVSQRLPSLLPYVKIVVFASSSSRQFRNAPYLARTIRDYCDSEALPSPAIHVRLYHFKLGPDIAHSLFPQIVTHVHFIQVDITRNDVWPFLCSLSGLQYLEFSGVRSTGLPVNNHISGGTFDGIPLSTLRMSAEPVWLILSFIHTARSLTHLEDFGIKYEDCWQEQLSQLAVAIQRTVKCLRFGANRYPDNEWDEHRRLTRIPEFVSRFESLNTLVLDNLMVDGSRGDDMRNPPFQWIPKVLQQLSSPIRKLVLEVTASSHLELRRFPWGSIDKIVRPETRQFRELLRVEVWVTREAHKRTHPDPVGRDLALAEIVQRLPALHRLGLLRCNTEGY